MATTTVALDTKFLGHPRGLATLFFTEMWERFSYYGMRALLILFMTTSTANGGLGFDVAKAGIIYGLYTSMVYLLSLPGGWVADRLIGPRRAVLYGGLLIIAGQFSLAVPGMTSFYVGLVLIVCGTGLLKPNVSTIVGMLYPAGDARRDAGFSIFYMGINLGAFISPLICGWIGQQINWRLGFGVAGFGMLIGVIQYSLGSKYLGDAGAVAPNREAIGRGVWIGIASSAAFVVAVIVAGQTGMIDITPKLVSNAVGVGLLAIAIAVFSWLLAGPGWTALERKRSLSILVLFLAACLFWSAFEQAGSSLTLFADRSTAQSVLGFKFPSSWFQMEQPLFIIALAPVFAWIWLGLGKHEPSSPAKFAWGLLLVGLGFAVLVPAAAMAGSTGRVSVMWLTTAYFLHTVGELCLSPVGLSAMTKLAPERVSGLMMGVWFMSISVGNYLGGQAAALYESMPVSTLFTIVAAFAIGAAVVLALMVKPTVRLMSGVK